MSSISWACFVLLSFAGISSAQQQNSDAVAYEGLGLEVQCLGRKCLSSDDCCSKTACVDPNGVDGSSHSEGICVPLFPASAEELCRGGDCIIAGRDAGTISKLKQYNDECVSSSECDMTRGLCCQFMRRHRMAPRQICSYFVDPKRCVSFPHQRVTEGMLSPKLNSFFKALMG